MADYTPTEFMITYRPSLGRERIVFVALVCPTSPVIWLSGLSHQIWSLYTNRVCSELVRRDFHFYWRSDADQWGTLVCSQADLFMNYLQADEWKQLFWCGPD